MWQLINTAPKKPIRCSPQSEWFKGRRHGPIICLAFRDVGFEEWETQIGWWQPDGDPCWRFLEDDGACDVQPTHWMPLPDAPR